MPTESFNEMNPWAVRVYNADGTLISHEQAQNETWAWSEYHAIKLKAGMAAVLVKFINGRWQRIHKRYKAAYKPKRKTQPERETYARPR